MKLHLETIAIVLVLGFASSANAESQSHWVQVEGGSWVPSTETISRIKGQIESFVRTQAKAGGRELHDWKTYTFQYQGQEESGKKFVFVNAFCVNDKRWKLNKKMVLVLDEGTCFFNVKYDPEENQFFGLTINGEA